MRAQFLPIFVAAAILGGCAGLDQFPKSSTGYDEALEKLDKEYALALKAVDAATDAEKKKNIRNGLIEKRLAVIDVHFKNFVEQLAKDNARVDLGVSLVGVGVGAAGSLASETASQILSAVSGGLTGSQAAYSKAVLYEKTIGALIAQMQASRKAISAEIFESWSGTLDAYPMWRARQHLAAYQFAGSIPGAILGTSADAKVKNDEAEARITLTTQITKTSASPVAIAERKTLRERIDALDAAKAKALMTRIESDFPGIKRFVEVQYPNARRDSDADGSGAKAVLKRLVILTGSGPEATKKWDAAIKGL